MSRRLSAQALAAAIVVAGTAVLVASPVPAYADGDTCDSIDGPDTESARRPDPSQPVADLRIEEAHKLVRDRGAEPGAGAVVAVVDSGIGGLPVATRKKRTTGPELADWHGTAMAGVIAGPPDGDRVIGIAPAADLVDVQVYDSLTPDDDETGLTPDGVAAGLQYLAADHANLGTDIVVVPMPVAKTDALTAAVDALAELDVIVVAASGDRPDEDSDPLHDEFGRDQVEGSSGRPAGEDAARDAWPAGYDSVVAVSTTVADGDASDVVLQNSAIDVAAPSTGAVGYGINGKPCVVPEPGTAWAAAEVAGVLALLESAYPDETAKQLVARLEDTATGTTTVSPNNVLTGHGIIQPLEALRRPLRPDPDGGLATSRVRDRDNVPAPVPESAPDLLESTREDAVWWGLLGGGALLVAMVLRPVLARRRR